MLLEMFELASVQIPYKHSTLKRSLKAYWTDFSGELLALLTEWLQCGLAASLRMDDPGHFGCRFGLLVVVV